MSKQAVFTMKLEQELRDEFMIEARSTHRPASQLVRDFMREFVQHQHQLRDHDTWFKQQVQASIDDNSLSLPHEQVMDKMKQQLLLRLTKNGKS